MSTPSTDLATVTTAEIEAIVAQQEEQFDSSLFQTPILKIGQPLTREVQDEQAESGEFINTLTGDGLGDRISFIVAYYNTGRFAADRDSNRAFVAFDTHIPAAWADLVGEEFVGTPFAEYPDAEERFKERVNAKEIEWGSGPLVATTHNYSGYALVSPPAEADEDESVEYQPVRLSLQRTNMDAVRKLTTIKRSILRNKPFWDIVFDLSTFRKDFAKGPAYLLKVGIGRATEADEKAMAADLARAVIAGQVVSNETPDEDAAGAPQVEPEAKGGLAV